MFKINCKISNLSISDKMKKEIVEKYIDAIEKQACKKIVDDIERMSVGAVTPAVMRDENKITIAITNPMQLEKAKELDVKRRAIDSLPSAMRDIDVSI